MKTGRETEFDILYECIGDKTGQVKYDQERDLVTQDRTGHEAAMKTGQDSRLEAEKRNA